MVLEVKDLRLVDAVAAHGSLTRAAAVLHLTQSALSHQLADLERRLATPLFVRSGRRMVLTPAGTALRASAASILGAMARAEEDVRKTASVKKETLRFSTECYTCYHWLPATLREYQARFPHVEPRIVAAATRRPMAALLRGELDVAIVSTPVRNRSVKITPLFQDELVAIVAADHPWVGRRYVTARDFADQDVVLYTMEREESTLLMDVLAPAGIEPRSVSQLELTEAVIELVKAGMGVGLLARWAVAPHVRSGTIATVPVTKPGLHRTWMAATMDRKPIPPHVDGFVDLLGSMLAPRRGLPLTLVGAS
jgi:LysR family transcriptional regulator for metE and metH